jgi:hypothetical protein
LHALSSFQRTDRVRVRFEPHWIARKNDPQPAELHCKASARLPQPLTCSRRAEHRDITRRNALYGCAGATGSADVGARKRLRSDSVQVSHTLNHWSIAGPMRLGRFARRLWKVPWRLPRNLLAVHSPLGNGPRLLYEGLARVRVDFKATHNCLRLSGASPGRWPPGARLQAHTAVTARSRTATIKKPHRVFCRQPDRPTDALLL